VFIEVGMEKPNCFKCKHYFVTFDQSNPRGCRKYQIKSSLMPSIVVKQASSSECLAFEAKNNKNIKTKNLSDDKYW